MLVAATSPSLAQNANEPVERRNLNVLTAPPEALSDAVIQSDGPFEMDKSGFGDMGNTPEPDQAGMGQNAASSSQTLPSSGADSGADNNAIVMDEGLANSKPLRVGLMALHGAQYLRTRVEPFRSYLQETLSRPVEIVPFNNIEALISAQTTRKIDYASYPASVFAMANASCGCVTPLVAPVSAKAPDGVYMLLVVRGDGPIKSLADMMGHSLALSSKTGAIPFHMALHQLGQAGLNAERDLSSIVSKKDPLEALSVLEDGEVDAALVWSTTPYNQSLFSAEGAVSAYKQSLSKGRSQSTVDPNFISIWQSTPVPAGPHVVHNDMPKQEKADLVNALVEMNKRDPAAYDAIERHYDGGFKAVSLKDYTPLLEIATAR